jgi:hypothetical protein
MKRTYTTPTTIAINVTAPQLLAGSVSSNGNSVTLQNVGQQNASNAASRYDDDWDDWDD